MKIMEFSEQTVIIAENQPEYQNLPAHVCNDKEGRVICCWQLSWKERFKVLFGGGLIWHQIYTFGTALQPQLLTVEKPEMKAKE